MDLNIHKNISDKLNDFIKNNNIPHIIFYGPIGVGKKTILNNFINVIYDNDIEKIKNYVMIVNCAHSKGIKFIRDELKFFAKSNIHHNNCMFKSIILLNADKLTIDAQSALRRCIEQYSHTTRFFIIVLNKDKLLKPIISRFCNIYIPKPIINNKIIDNLYLYNNTNILKNEYQLKRNKWLINKLYDKKNYNNLVNSINFINKLYSNGYSGLDILKIIENDDKLDYAYKSLCLLYFDKLKLEIKNEKLFMFYIIYFIFMRKTLTLNNII